MKKLTLDLTDYGIYFIILLGSGIFGNVLHDIIMSTTNESLVFPLGAVCVVGIAIIYFIATGWFSDRLEFNLRVSMGCTRKEYFFCRVVNMLVKVVITMATLLMIYYIEILKFKIFYPGYEIDFEVDKFFNFPMLFVFLISVAMLSFLMSVIIMKIGKAAFWVFWGIYMLSIASGKYIIPAIVKVVSAEQIYVVVGMLVLSLAAVVVSKILVMKQAVTL